MLNFFNRYLSTACNASVAINTMGAYNRMKPNFARTNCRAPCIVCALVHVSLAVVPNELHFQTIAQGGFVNEINGLFGKRVNNVY